MRAWSVTEGIDLSLHKNPFLHSPISSPPPQNSTPSQPRETPLPHSTLRTLKFIFSLLIYTTAIIPAQRHSQFKLSPPSSEIGRPYNLSEMPPIRQTASPQEVPGIMPQGIKRSRQACDTCRRKKSRCTGEKPVCATCKRLKQECSYKESFMGSFPERYKDMEGQLMVCHLCSQLIYCRKRSPHAWIGLRTCWLHGSSIFILQLSADVVVIHG